jgi:spore germination protein PE
MLSRISQVQTLNIISASSSSVIQIGDSQIINMLSRALAVQREVEIFYSYEGDFSLFPLFREPIPLPPIKDEVMFQKIDFKPCIQVNEINITGAASASVIHVGNTEHVYMESRVKHIRDLLDEK